VELIGRIDSRACREQAVRAAGYSDAQVIEIVQHLALNTWTDYINEVAATDIDFPALETA